jgi:hypothetical protein
MQAMVTLQLLGDDMTSIGWIVFVCVVVSLIDPGNASLYTCIAGFKVSLHVDARVLVRRGHNAPWKLGPSGLGVY